MPESLRTKATSKAAKPFVKWVGGKSRLVPQLAVHFPDSYNKYFEPFVGGGAVFFALAPKAAHLNDINATLIHAYQDIRDRPEDLLSRLQILQDEYYASAAEKQKELFYQVRDAYNHSVDSPIERTAELIFLNKTCFNGMYRENAKGGFNVPFGKHSKPNIADEHNIIEVSRLLQSVDLSTGGYELAVSGAEAGDFVYFDPPYYPLTETSSFTSYSKDNFIKKEQEELKNTFDELTKRGVKVMLSNSSADYIKELYKEYRQVEIMAGRAINAQADKRGKIEELLVINY